MKRHQITFHKNDNDDCVIANVGAAWDDGDGGHGSLMRFDANVAHLSDDAFKAWLAAVEEYRHRCKSMIAFDSWRSPTLSDSMRPYQRTMVHLSSRQAGKSEALRAAYRGAYPKIVRTWNDSQHLYVGTNVMPAKAGEHDLMIAYAQVHDEIIQKAFFRWSEFDKTEVGTFEKFLNLHSIPYEFERKPYAHGGGERMEVCGRVWLGNGDGNLFRVVENLNHNWKTGEWDSFDEVGEVTEDVYANLARQIKAKPPGVQVTTFHSEEELRQYCEGDVKRVYPRPRGRWTIDPSKPNYDHAYAIDIWRKHGVQCPKPGDRLVGVSKEKMLVLLGATLADDEMIRAVENAPDWKTYTVESAAPYDVNAANVAEFERATGGVVSGRWSSKSPARQQLPRDENGRPVNVTVHMNATNFPAPTLEKVRGNIGKIMEGLRRAKGEDAKALEGPKETTADIAALPAVDQPKPKLGANCWHQPDFTKIDFAAITAAVSGKSKD